MVWVVIQENASILLESILPFLSPSVTGGAECRLRIVDIAGMVGEPSTTRVIWHAG
ncbi:hypothetical protein KIN20_013872 [Parelaphostrongylus tenuis]|uniref:Uncharacterized protein n=1 Tax=Parelaphostrongylus tenuis TaxID=148309 RepID=A0AAD5QLA0_PARTN|nr:hypothetical protein KIN20_013872 [Parelaphostrongylus tenuis]